MSVYTTKELLEILPHRQPMLLIDTYVNQSVIVIHADRNILPYLFWNLANRYEELRAISDSSSIRGSLTTKMIAAFEIPLANNDVIQTFSDFAWAVIPQIENNLLENERLAALRDSLLPKLMSGEIDVSTSTFDSSKPRSSAGMPRNTTGRGGYRPAS